MYIPTSTKEDSCEALSYFENKDIVIHYKCHYCQDEQVTDELTISEDMVEEFKNDDLKVNYDCTNCSVTTKYITEDNIIGVEVI